MSHETDMIEYNNAIKYIRRKLAHLPKSKKLNAVVVMRRADNHTVEVVDARNGRIIENFLRNYIPFSCKVHLWGDK